jgi:hypothetical protein
MLVPQRGVQHVANSLPWEYYDIGYRVSGPAAAEMAFVEGRAFKTCHGTEDSRFTIDSPLPNSTVF